MYKYASKFNAPDMGYLLSRQYPIRERLYRRCLCVPIQQLGQRQKEQNTGLRIKLLLDDAPELGDLPWEMLFDKNRKCFLAQSRFTPIIRCLELAERTDRLPVELPLHILVAMASPVSCVELDVENERAVTIVAI